MSNPRQHTIIKVFRKYSNSLGSDALDLIQEILDAEDATDDNLEEYVDALAKEYNMQEDAQMKVSAEILLRVYHSLKEQGDGTSNEPNRMDPDSHLFVIDAFEMPLWHWSTERGTFEKASGSLSVSGSADSRVLAARNRLNVIKQCVLRNEHFAPSTLPSRDRDKLVTLRSTKQLLGRAGERFLLFGMLVHNKEGKVCLEDSDGNVELNFSTMDEPSEGFFTEGCFALVEGEYTEESTIDVIAIGQPPCEPRHTARSIYGHIDFLGSGATSLLEDTQYAVRMAEDLKELNFFFLSDVCLNNPQTLSGLKKMFDTSVETDYLPTLVVLCGNFTSKSISTGNSRDIQLYQESFDALADLIASYPTLAKSTHFVLVPGPLDIAGNNNLPRRPLLSAFTSRLRSKVSNLHLASNPCRIKFFHQEIVVFRDNLMSKMLRNIIGVKPDVKSEDLKRFLVQSILDQAHLSPFTVNIQPTLSDYDHTLRLYPLPTMLVLADKYERYRVKYTGCHIVNPGSFVGSKYFFSSYNPSEINSEECELDIDEDE